MGHFKSCQYNQAMIHTTEKLLKDLPFMLQRQLSCQRPLTTSNFRSIFNCLNFAHEAT